MFAVLLATIVRYHKSCISSFRAATRLSYIYGTFSDCLRQNLCRNREIVTEANKKGRGAPATFCCSVVGTIPSPNIS